MFLLLLLLFSMYHHPATSQHIASVEKFGWEVVAPVAKELACGDVGE